MENPIIDPNMEEINALAEEAASELIHEDLVDAISEQMGTLEEGLRNPNLSDSEISEYEQQAIDECERESIGELIEQEFRQQGIPEDRIEKLKETGIEDLDYNIPTKKIPEQKEKNIRSPSKTGGSEGSPRAWHYPTEVKKYNDPPLPRGEKSAYAPTQRERLEAKKEGLTEFLENETRRPSNDPDIIRYRKREEEKTLEQLEKIEAQLEVLPPDPEKPKIEIEDITDEEAQAEGWQDNRERKHWKEGTAAHDQFLTDTSKKQKLNAIKSKLSVGITNEDLAACGSAEHRIAARAHLPLSMWPEHRTEPYDTDEFEEEIRLATEEDLEDEDQEENLEDDIEEESNSEEGQEY